MGFNIFRKKNLPTRSEADNTEASLTAEDLDKVDAGYIKTQDDINRILAESNPVSDSQNNELADMFTNNEQDHETKSYHR